jgi:hypothetical protein
MQSRVIGSNKNHLKISFKQNNKNIDGLYWNRTSIDAEAEDLVDAAFFAKSNFFNTIFQFSLKYKTSKMRPPIQGTRVTR